MATPEEILKEAKKLIGVETKPVKARYPVEYEPIRRWCHMADNLNPLFIDPEYAKKTKYGEVIMPPGAVVLYGPSLPGYFPPREAQEQLPEIPMPEGMNVPFAMGHEWEFLKPVKVGEWLSVKRRIADVYIKGMRFDPHTFWTITETIFMNEAGEALVVQRAIGLRFRGVEALRKAGITDYPK